MTSSSPDSDSSAKQDGREDQGDRDSAEATTVSIVRKGDRSKDRLRRSGPSSGNPDSRPQLNVGEMLQDRYEILEQLGRGGFGAVYRAFDHELNRDVAVKRARALRSFVAGQIRGEAKAIASLNHPNIISIYDLITIADHDLLIVMECPEGETLAEHQSKQPMQVGESVDIVCQIASALQHAHSRQLVHSDLKPKNILVASDGRIRLLDFGLAVACFPDPTSDNVTGGTPGYMSPEQIRGESHLIDGRADIWALGVIFYQLLTGVRPFLGNDGVAIFDATLHVDPPPIRQLCPEVDEELQRIVYRCLEKRMCDRYASASDLLDDLQAWRMQRSPAEERPVASLTLESEPTSDSLPRFQSRGLQPFTEQDSESYLTVVPGTRDRDGIPESIRFWKRWAESDDPEANSPVGVLYGPSGSGKTSFVRAGLVRQLDRSICCVYVECRPGDLGGRITKIIQSRIRDESASSSLRDLLTRLRTGDSSQRNFRKILIILDQFEVWAQGASSDERHDLADALRQCDGVQIRALVVTRDDYWMGITELLRWLELPLREGRNLASIDLIDPAHARRILESIGRATRSLPAGPVPLTPQQEQFIHQSVDELAIGESVIAVHLVMFAQMAMTREWSPRTLRASGGVTGACSLYLQELFGASSTTGSRSPELRRIAPAVLPILSALLPAVDSSVVESAKSELELRAEVEKVNCERLFEDALRMLCEDLRIVSVVDDDSSYLDSDRERDTDEQRIADQRHLGDQGYRLSHDFLVEPIREWIDRARKRTWRGRKLARLSEIAGAWNRRPSQIYMPGFFEFLSLYVVSRIGGCGERETDFIRAATKHHSGRISIAVVALLAFLLMTAVAIHQHGEARTARARSIASEVALLLNGPPEDVTSHIRMLGEHPRDAVLAVTPWLDSVDPQLKLRARLFLHSQQPGRFREFAPLIEEASTELFTPILQFAQSSREAPKVLTNIVRDPNASTKQINRAAILLMYLGDSSAVESLLSGSNDFDQDSDLWLEVAQWRSDPKPWVELLEQNVSPETTYQTAIILSTFPREQFDSSELSVAAPLLRSPHAVLHSVGRFLHAHLGADPYPVNLQAPPESDWRLGPDKIPMVKIGAAVHQYAGEPNSPDRMTELKIKEPFWIAAYPVSRQLFSEFMKTEPLLPDGSRIREPVVSSKIPDDLKADLSQPIVGINHTTAILFCNWLSRREGLEPCYRYVKKPADPDPGPLSREKFQAGPLILSAVPELPWDLIDAANGFRLPTPEQFVFVARCKYRHGLPWSHAKTLAEVGGDYSEAVGSEYPRPLFSLMPNRFGLFVNDDWCGTWVLGRGKGTCMRVDDKQVYLHVRHNRTSANHTIYLVRPEDVSK